MNQDKRTNQHIASIISKTKKDLELLRIPILKKGESGDEPAKNGIIHVPCQDIANKFEYFIIQSTTTELENNIKNMDKKLATEVFAQSHKNIHSYTHNTLIIEYEKQSQHWNNFCNDVILYYISRLVLFKSPIPILPHNFTI
jgi:hypothetical protein